MSSEEEVVSIQIDLFLLDCLNFFVLLTFCCKDLSLFTASKIQMNKDNKEPSVRPKVRSVRNAAAPRRYRCQSVSQSASEEHLINSLSELAIDSKKSRSSNLPLKKYLDIENNSLEGMSFTITGFLERITRDDLIELIECSGGTVYKTLAKKTQFLIIGNNASKTWIKNAIETGKEVLNEDDFFRLVQRYGKTKKSDKCKGYATKAKDVKYDNRYDYEDDEVSSSDGLTHPLNTSSDFSDCYQTDD